MKIRMQGWPVILFSIFFLWFLLVPLWKCSKHIKAIDEKIEMHFGPGPNSKKEKQKREAIALPQKLITEKYG